jgi:GH43 family beta-xylosidase
MRTRPHTIRAALLPALVALPLVACASAPGASAPGAGAPGASAPGASATSGSGAATTACTFANPIARGADPWVIRRDSSYYYVQSAGGGISVYRSSTLTGIRQHGVRVWRPPASGWNHSNIWAPELHWFDGKWYIYYAGGRAEGGPFVHQRAGVLESVTDDPQGAYVDRGMLYTGNDPASGGDSSAIWAIDLTVARINGTLYAVWSGWTDNAPAPGPLPDRKAQQLYIARMSNPYTITGGRVMIAAPTASWERGTELDLQEGPEFLQHDGQTFVVYSTRESWLPEYKLGQLRLTPATADPLLPSSWVKSGPVFVGAPAVGVFGVGHASFTTSPDGAEPWIVYHAKSKAAPGWDDRMIHMQKFGWTADGAPDFGTPVPNGQPIPVPSGQCGM